MNQKKYLLAALALLLAGPSAIVEAAEAPLLEEVVVTAEKRESTLQETPLAVTALTRDNLETRNIDDLAQVQFAAPALVFAEIADMAQITMRGVGVDISQMDAEPGVAVYADGVYRGGLTSSGSLLFDLERIEVLRGPQGTLYGRNAVGGGLNVISRLPGEEAAFDAALLYGDYGRTRVDLSGDIPVSPGVFALRAAVAWDQRDGYTDNRFTGREEDDAESKFVKLAAVITPSERTEITLRAEYTDTYLGGPPWLLTHDQPVPPLLLSVGNPGGILGIPGTVCGPASCAEVLGLNLSPPGVGSNDPRNTYADGRTAYDRKSWGLSATLDWDLNESVHLKSITSYFDIEQIGDNTNNDGVDITYLTDNFLQTNEEWSQEFTLTGSSAKLEWVLGAYYYQSDINQLFEFTLPALQATFEAVFGVFAGGPPLPSGSLVAFGNRINGQAVPFPFLDFQVMQDLTSTAFYGQGTYALTERVRGTVGLRWTKDEKDDTQTVRNNIGGDFCDQLALADEWTEVTGKAGLDMDVGENTLLYGSISTGFKAGGFNGGQCNNPFEPETLVAYEAGAKSRLLNDTLQLNVTAFFYDYSDLQARLFINNASIVRNATDAESHGVELEGIWLASPNLRLEGSVSWLQGEFKDFLSTNPMAPHIGMDCNPATGLDCLQDVSGNQLLRSPEWKASLTAELDVPMGSHTVTLRGEYAYTAELYHTVFNDGFSRQDSFSLYNLRAIWTPPENAAANVKVIAFVENVGDEEYIMIHAPNATTGGTISHFGPPRVWGVQVRYGR